MRKQNKKRQRANAPKKGVFKWHWWYRLQLASIGGDKERTYVLEYLSLLIQSGTQLPLALHSIASDLKNKALAYRLWEMKTRIEQGVSFSDAMEASKLYRSQVVSILRVGETAGQLPQSLESIAKQQRKQRQFQSKVQSAAMYPALVLMVTAAVAIGITWFILPQLAGVFDSLDMELPLITRIIMWVGFQLQDYGFIIVPAGILLSIITIYVVFFLPKTRIIGQWILFGTPGIRRLIQQIELSRFGYTLGSLLESGLPINEAIDALVTSTQFYRYKRLYKRLLAGVVEGETFELVFSQVKHSKALIPHTIQQMVETGESSGKLAGVFMRIGETYEERTDITTKNLSVILEPLMLIFVWIGVSVVALSIILPVYSLVGNVVNQPGVPGATVRSVETSSVRGTEALDAVIAPDSVVEEAPEESISDIPEETLSASGTIVVPGDLLNLREEPSTTATILDQIPDGTSVEILDRQADWVQVLFEDVTGWVSDQYVE